MNQIMKTGFFGGGSDAGGAISGAAYLHTIGKTIISSINRNEAIYTFIAPKASAEGACILAEMGYSYC